MHSKYGPYLFFACLLAELTAIAAGWNQLQLFTKPLLLLFLFTWFMLASKNYPPLRYLVAAALFFSWLGDIFLLFEAAAAVWFMAGLASFLVAHLLYILFFMKLRQRLPGSIPWNFFIVAMVAVYAFSLFAFLRPHTGNLQLPVGIYAITIACMLVAAVHAFNRRYVMAGRYCIAGAFLFLCSDSVLALNKFYQAFPGAGVLIMLSYGLAQFAIAKGSLLYLAGLKNDQPPDTQP